MSLLGQGHRINQLQCNSENRAQLTGRKYQWVIIVLVFLWIMPGLLGHDPWKADEPYSFGLVAHILNTGDWVVPTLVGDP